MISEDYVIIAPEGLHARPATALLKLARSFKSSINLKKGDQLIPTNSMLSLISLSAKCGETVSVVIEGVDELEAAKAIKLFFEEQIKEL